MNVRDARKSVGSMEKEVDVALRGMSNRGMKGQNDTGGNDSERNSGQDAWILARHWLSQADRKTRAWVCMASCQTGIRKSGDGGKPSINRSEQISLVD